MIQKLHFPGLEKNEVCETEPEVILEIDEAEVDPVDQTASGRNETIDTNL